MLLTIKEVAARLRISISLAYRLVARGEIPCYEIASCKRVAESDLDKYLELQRIESNRLPQNTRKHF
ncbi:helix-turn-helix domain-containing protein [Aeoliella sp.]|uniref:helix-turn-helix domain-containing protein n=1 Tax=Aeoliella sp. TaxID=2795800 RepID=UPI003CCBCD7C